MGSNPTPSARCRRYPRVWRVHRAAAALDRIYQFDPRAMAGGCGQTTVARQQRRVEHLGQRDIRCVIGRQIVSQFPKARQKEIMRVSPQRKVREVGERRTSAPASAIRCVAPDHLCDFNIEQMRRVKRLTRGEQPILHGFRRRRAQQDFEQGGSVDDDHARSRSARTGSDGVTERAVSVRLCSRVRSSSSVGRSAS